MTSHGLEYAKALGDYFGDKYSSLSQSEPVTDHHDPYLQDDDRRMVVWSSALKRTVETSEQMDPNLFEIMHMRVLNEIYAGSFDGMPFVSIYIHFEDLNPFN